MRGRGREAGSLTSRDPTGTLCSLRAVGFRSRRPTIGSGRMSAGTSVKLVLPSEVRLIDLVHTASEQMAGLAGFDEDEALNVGLAVREAVINAMVHGNGEDPARSVSVALTIGADALQATVCDQGNGFDPERAPDPRSGENRLRTSGRGLLLMEAFVDEVEIRRQPTGGMEVVMKKRLPDKSDEDGDS